LPQVKGLFQELTENKDKTTFKELQANSIIFSEPKLAKDRRNARSARRNNERKSIRKRNGVVTEIRTLFLQSLSHHFIL
jgi:hypothetical protein